jgi:hypothetical protein
VNVTVADETVRRRHYVDALARDRKGGVPNNVLAPGVLSKGFSTT